MNLLLCFLNLHFYFCISIWLFLLFCWYLLINSYRNCRSAYYVSRLLIFYQFIVCIFSVYALHLLPSLLLFCCTASSSSLAAFFVSNGKHAPLFTRLPLCASQKSAITLRIETRTYSHTHTPVYTLIETGRNYSLLTRDASDAVAVADNEKNLIESANGENGRERDQKRWSLFNFTNGTDQARASLL